LLHVIHELVPHGSPLFFERNFVRVSVASGIYCLHVLFAHLLTFCCVWEVNRVVSECLVVTDCFVENCTDVVSNWVESSELKVDENYLLVVLVVHQYVVLLRVVVAENNFPLSVYHRAEKLGVTLKQECLFEVFDNPQNFVVLACCLLQQLSSNGRQLGLDYGSPLLDRIIDD